MYPFGGQKWLLSGVFGMTIAEQSHRGHAGDGLMIARKDTTLPVAPDEAKCTWSCALGRNPNSSYNTECSAAG